MSNMRKEKILTRLASALSVTEDPELKNQKYHQIQSILDNMKTASAAKIEAISQLDNIKQTVINDVEKRAEALAYSNNDKYETLSFYKNELYDAAMSGDNDTFKDQFDTFIDASPDEMDNYGEMLEDYTKQNAVYDETTKTLEKDAIFLANTIYNKDDFSEILDLDGKTLPEYDSSSDIIIDDEVLDNASDLLKVLQETTSEEMAKNISHQNKENMVGMLKYKREMDDAVKSEYNRLREMAMSD